MRLIIAGSRTLSVPPETIDSHVRLLESWGDTVTTVLCGMAKGIDLCGLAWAESHGILVERYPADWNTHGKAAGPIRNRQMAENADALLLIWDGKSRGSANMLKQAEEFGLALLEVKVE